MDKKSSKIIHYIWFGGNPLSDLTKKCIQTWKKYLPDFEIMEWNEKTFDVNQCPFIKEAYEQKKWAFVADYTRFKVIEEYGGIYLDTDMEITADIAEFLKKDLFMGVEDSKMINAAVVWAKEPHNPHIKNIVDIYESKKHFNETGDLYDESVPKVLTKYFSQFGFDGEKDEIQIFDDGKVYIYPMEYFYPLSYDYQHNKFTDNSVMIHHFDATWISPMEKFKTKMKRKNMIWVVYVIDFFVSIKNKIKFFSNYRDLLTFFTMFFILMGTLLAITPIDNELRAENFRLSVAQITAVSLIWTFVVAKIRNMKLNSYVDKMLGRSQEDIDNGIIKNQPLNLKQTLKLQKMERIVFLIQYVITLIVSLTPIFQASVIFANQNILFTIASLINMYMIYVGINKKFRYRILELVPFGVVLGLLIVSNFTIGLLTAISTFVFILINMLKKEPKKKRIYAFVASSVICCATCLCISIFCGSENKINFHLGLKPESVVENYSDQLLDSNVSTEFNYIKNVVNSNIKNVSENVVLNSTTLYFITALIISIFMIIISKDKNYLFLVVIVIFNTVQVAYSGENFGKLNVIILGFLLLIVIQNGILTMIDRD